MTCTEVESVLAAFVDGELCGTEMRRVARHLAACPGCEAASARMERLQETVRGAVLSAAGEPDAQAVWRAIAPHLPALRPSWWSWVADVVRRPVRAGVPVPLWAGGVAAAVLVGGLLLWAGGWGESPGVGGPSTLNQQARIDSLEAPGNVRVWNRADTGAIVIWVDDGGMNVERLDP